jgi:hypothetical protein
VRGSRINVKAAAGRISVEYDDTLDADANHVAAAEEFCKRYGWRGSLVQGILPDGSHVFTLSDPRETQSTAD